ncbi:hypothetical protein ATO1_25910 [Phaeobacter sp. 22II1-1F12B]|nr:hypothetical protein ATO1_25910 [Phaeobacter sp. 22II1-1F12B]
MRTPAQIIGQDALTQLAFEGYAVLPLETVAGLRECVEASIEGPKRDRKILSRKVGDIVPLPTFILKGQGCARCGCCAKSSKRARR